MLHTLGFVHEHNRPDRNHHISVNWDNFKPGKDTFFSKRKQGNDLEKEGVTEKGLIDMKNMPYDALSVMHYGPKVFAKTNRKKSIISSGHPFLSFIGFVIV